MYAAIDRDVYIYRLEASIEEIGSLITKYRFKRCFVVFDQQINTVDLEALKIGLAKYGVEYHMYEAGNVSFRLVDEGYRTCLSEKFDCVIGIGGLAALDCAKGINLLRFNGGDIKDYTNPNARRNPGSGLFCIPTIDGDEERLLLSLEVVDNNNDCFYVDCYCNYYIKIMKQNN